MIKRKEIGDEIVSFIGEHDNIAADKGVGKIEWRFSRCRREFCSKKPRISRHHRAWRNQPRVEEVKRMPHLRGLPRRNIEEVRPGAHCPQQMGTVIDIVGRDRRTTPEPLLIAAKPLRSRLLGMTIHASLTDID